MKPIDTVKDGLTRKIGPLPGWAWGVVGAAGIWIWRAMQSSTTRRDATAEAGTSLIPGLSGGGVPAPQTPYSGPVAGSESPVYVNTPGFSVEAPPELIGSLLDQLLNTQPVEPVGTPADPYVYDPYVPPPPPPAAPVITGYLTTTTGPQRLFRDLATCERYYLPSWEAQSGERVISRCVPQYG